MDEKISKILNDIYMVDESFKEREEELVKIIDELLRSKPEVKIDENFISELRAQVLGRAKEVAAGREETTGFFSGLFSFNKMAYALGGAVIAVLIVIPFVNMIDKSSAPLTQKSLNIASDVSTEVKIARLENNAFGPLGGNSGEQGAPMSPSAEPGAAVAENMAVGSTRMFEAEIAEDAVIGSEAVPAPAVDQAVPQIAKGIGGGGGGGGMGVVGSAKMIAPDYVNYTYVYRGGELPSYESDMPVFKRVKDKTFAIKLAGVLANLDIGLLDLGKFKNTSISNLNFSEDRDFGYSVYLNFEDSSMGINMNWLKWPRPETKCEIISSSPQRNESAIQNCYDSLRLKESDMPEDGKIIAMADAFLREYGIKTDNYGEPEINDFWRREYSIARDNSMIGYIPDSVPVIYPLKLDGRVVYDESGQKSGLTVDVSVRYAKVINVYGLTAPQYESANYKTAGAEEIIKYAERGGSGYYYMPEEGKTHELELGSPEMGLTRHWQYNPAEGNGTELFVPAFIFPILNPPTTGYYYRTHVVVPIIAEILGERDGIDRPVPMPLMRGGTAPSGAPGIEPMFIEAEEGIVDMPVTDPVEAEIEPPIYYSE